MEDEEWTTAQLRKDQEEDVDIGPLPQMERKWGGTAKLVGNIRRVTHFQGVMAPVELPAYRERIA